MSATSALRLDAAKYVRHAVHVEPYVWIEKNCYVDVWIEVVHAAGLDPMAMFPFTLASDFDGDQWTFFKPPHRDLTKLYGLGVQELNVWKPILSHALYHLNEGRLVFTEADAFFLPDTRGTDYRTQHTKSTIVIETIDVERRRMGYFHNAGYFELEGEDFAKLFRLDEPSDPTFLPLFAELVKLDRIERLAPAELASRSCDLLGEWLALRPRSNPLRRFAARMGSDIEGLRSDGIAAYHAYAFATIRQCGANFELSAAYLRWLERNTKKPFERSASRLDAISNGAKTLILKGARAVGGNKVVDFAPMIEEMAGSWDAAMTELDTLVAG